jgi:hypothetical protein
LQPQFFEQLENQEKKAEYQSYLMNNVRQLWYFNTESHFVAHMAEVSAGRGHNDKQLDGTSKRKWKYPINTLYKLDTPLYPNDQQLQKKNPRGPVYTTMKPNVKLTKLWHNDQVKMPRKPTKEDMKKINKPNGFIYWEAAPIETWGIDPPSSPKPPSPPPLTKTDKQKHAAMHWSFCRKRPDCPYH